MGNRYAIRLLGILSSGLLSIRIASLLPSPAEFASAYQVPLEAVLEALDYAAQNRPLIEQERDREAKLRAWGFDGPAQG